MSRGDGLQRAHEVLDYVGLGEARYRAVESYSTGMKQRLKLASAIVRAVEVLGDLSLFPKFADRLQQGLLNFLFVGRALAHPRGLTAHAAYRPDDGRLVGIDGLTLTAGQPPRPRPVWIGRGADSQDSLAWKRSSPPPLTTAACNVDRRFDTGRPSGSRVTSRDRLTGLGWPGSSTGGVIRDASGTRSVCRCMRTSRRSRRSDRARP